MEWLKDSIFGIECQVFHLAEQPMRRGGAQAPGGAYMPWCQGFLVPMGIAEIAPLLLHLDDGGAVILAVDAPF